MSTIPRIHITAVASPTVTELKRLTAGSFDPASSSKHKLPSGTTRHSRDPQARAGLRELLTLAQDAVGMGCRVTANSHLIVAEENDYHGGRSDDAARATEVQAVLGDDDIAAMVTMRGGAWFVRILDRINFDILKRRRRPLYIFGFSEMTPLVAIAGQYRQAVALYDLGPGFLYTGVKRHVLTHMEQYARGVELSDDQHYGFASGWALARFRSNMADFFREVAGVIEGRPSHRVPTGRVLAGKLPAHSTITITGGNLSLISAMMGSPYAAAFDTKDKWLAIEEVNEAPDKCDRMLAGLKHNGLLDRAEGIILGDFHDDDREFVNAAFEVLKHHLPTGKRIPVIHLSNFGHIWPIAPLPMHRPVTLRSTPARSGQNVTIEIPWDKWPT